MKTFLFKKNKIKNVAGYTMIELLIATTVFTIVALGALTILFAAQNGYDRVSGSRIITDNINLVLDTMSREIKFGTDYLCVNSIGNFASTLNPNYNVLPATSAIGKCNAIAFFPQGKTDEKIVYYFNTASSTINQVKYNRSGTSFMRDLVFGDVSLTSTGFKVVSLNFELSGISRTDYLQPKVFLTTTGVIDFSIKKNGAIVSTTTFSAQTTITQRLLDN